MNLKGILTYISAIIAVFTFIDTYLLNSRILNSLSLPSTIPISIFFILIAIFLYTIFSLSKKRINLPYPDLSSDVKALEDELETIKNNNCNLNEEKLKLSSELESLKVSSDDDEQMFLRIKGVLVKKTMSFDKLTEELRITNNDVSAISNLQRILGVLVTDGKIKCTVLGDYEYKASSQ